jgi:NAD(P)H-flavin reductase
MIAEGVVSELILLDKSASARIRCPEGVIPAPGQYVLAFADGSDGSLASVLFSAGASSDGFIAASPVPPSWLPGTRLSLRGPLGHGFTLPAAARRIALIAHDCSPLLLLSLLEASSRQEASVTLVAREMPDDLPLQVEAQPPEALHEVCAWADYIAFDVQRDTLNELRESLKETRAAVKAQAQVLVRTPMPCGALAACGICTVEVGGKALLACDDGPVFDLHQLMGWSSSA